jgi:hypothetical protein
MAIKLIVTQDFGDHHRGSEITDAEEVARILDSEHQAYVVKVNAPDPAEQTPQ